MDSTLKLPHNLAAKALQAQMRHTALKLQPLDGLQSAPLKGSWAEVGLPETFFAARGTVRDAMIKEHTLVKDKLKVELKSYPFVYITMDGWSRRTSSHHNGINVLFMERITIRPLHPTSASLAVCAPQVHYASGYLPIGTRRGSRRQNMCARNCSALHLAMIFAFTL